MPSNYSLFTGDASSYIQLKDGAAVDYPEQSIINVFGPLYAPRIYGKDLTTFEIASSGSVSIALNDVRALDIYNSANVNYITSQSNNSLKLSAGTQCNSTILLNHSSYDVALTSQSNVTSTASNNAVTTVGNDIVSTASNDVKFTASNTFSNVAKNDYAVASTAGDVVVTAASDVNVTATANAVSLLADGSKVSLKLDDATHSLVGIAFSNVSFTASNTFSALSASNSVITASNDVVFTASNTFSNVAKNDYAVASTAGDVVVTAASDVNVTATANAVSLLADGSKVSLKLDDATHSLVGIAFSNVSFTASNTFSALSASNAVITASNDVVFTASNTFSNVAKNDYAVASTAGDVVVTAASDVNVTATANAVSLLADGSKVSLKLDDATHSLVGIAFSNVSFTASNTFSALSASNAVITASNDVKFTASNSFSNVAKNNYSVASTAGDVVVTAASDVNVTATTNAVSLSANAGQVTFKLDDVTSGIQGNALSNVSFVAGNDLTLEAASNGLFTFSNNFTTNVENNLELKSAGGDVLIHAFNGSNEMKLIMDNSEQKIFINAPNGVEILGGNGNSTQNTQGSYIFNVANTEVFRVTDKGIQVTGDTQIAGILDTIGIHNTELWIQDKNIVLGMESNNAQVIDGLANDGGGVRIWGVPEASASNDDERYIKSFTWKKSSQGVMDLGGSKKSGSEAYWELRGGHMRLTHTKTSNGNRKVSFAMRVNDLDELEFVKMGWSNDVLVTNKVIAKFGQNGMIV